MALINLRTNLKSLKFGKDRPGGGSSNQPYIQTPIPDGESIPSGPDFILRGGLLAPVRAATDVSRLAQMFFDLKTPNGFLFTAKQNLLSRTSVKTQASKGIGTAGGLVNAGVYLPSSTLAQAGVGFLGTHLNLLGLDPTGLTSASIKTYSELLSPELGLAPSIKDLDSNRLVQLNKAINEERTISNFNFQLGVNLNSGDNIIEYGGGPNSILGVGKTRVKFADPTLLTGRKNPNWKSIAEGKYQVGLINSSTDRSDTIDKATFPIGASNKWTSFGGTGLADFTSSFNFNGNYYSPTFTTNVYKSGSLNTISGLPQYQVGIVNSSTDRSDTINKIILPTGVSNKWISSGGTGLTDFTSSFDFNGYYYSPTFATNVYKSGSLEDIPNLPQNNTTFTLTQKQISDREITKPGGDYKEDFRKDIQNTSNLNYSKAISLSPSYISKNIHTRVSLGDPGKSNTSNGTKNVLNYGLPANTLEALDKITAMPMYEGAGPNTNLAINDLVKFRIAVLDNTPGNNGISTYLHFRAFIDSFTDSFSNNWTPVNYVGRGEPLYHYNGNFQRKISMGFKVAAQSKAELIPMYKKLNYLASSLAPDYNDAGYMKGNLVRLTVGGYIYEQYGFIDSLTYTIPNESPWEISIDQNGDSDKSVKELPHIIEVSMNFTPIQNFLPKKANNPNNPDERFISLANIFNSRGNYTDQYKSYKASPNATIPGEGG
jgi:hypothetical protein